MSERSVTRALRQRFESIRQAELERLDKKLRGLTDDDRRSVEAITADVIHAIACEPDRALSSGATTPSLDALVRLFALDNLEVSL